MAQKTQVAEILAETIKEMEVKNISVTATNLIDQEAQYGRTHSRRDIIKAIDVWRDNKLELDRMAREMPFNFDGLVGLIAKEMSAKMWMEFSKRYKEMEDKYTEEITTLRQARDGISDQLEALSDKLKNTVAELNEVKNQNEDLQADKLELERRLQEMAAENKALNKSLNGSNASVKSLLDQVLSMLKDHNDGQDDDSQGGDDQ